MNSQSRVLIARLPSFAVAAIDLAIYSDCMAFIYTDDENGILAVFEFHGQIIHSSIKVVKTVGRTRILAHFSLSQTVGKLICGSLLLLVLAVRIYTLVQLLC